MRWWQGNTFGGSGFSLGLPVARVLMGLVIISFITNRCNELSGGANCERHH